MLMGLVSGCAFLSIDFPVLLFSSFSVENAPVM